MAVQKSNASRKQPRGIAPRDALKPGAITRREWLRFLDKITLGESCLCQQDSLHHHWLWKAGKFSDGYGGFLWRGRQYKAHRFAFIALKGAIPSAHVPDHLCRIRHCVNPDCLEPVTHRENSLRGDTPSAKNHQKSHCLNGHALTPDNLVRYHWEKRGFRICKRCATAKSRQAMAKLREENPAFRQRQLDGAQAWRERKRQRGE